MANFTAFVLTATPPGIPAAEAGGAYVKIDGREALLRSVELFLNRESISRIVLCFLPEQLEQGKQKYGSHLSFSGVKVCSGGPRWIDQLTACKAVVADGTTHVIVHDAARPCVAYNDIDALLSAAEKHPAVVLASPLRAPLIEIEEADAPVATHPAARMLSLLTPQVYSADKFAEMVAKRSELHPSELSILRGSGLNVRVISSADATLIKAMMNLLPKPKIKGPTNPFEEAQW
jgi:2-C-methyl-D-erythritol 4-phosphate cytidylyltransferase